MKIERFFFYLGVSFNNFFLKLHKEFIEFTRIPGIVIYGNLPSFYGWDFPEAIGFEKLIFMTRERSFFGVKLEVVYLLKTVKLMGFCWQYSQFVYTDLRFSKIENNLNSYAADGRETSMNSFN